MVLKRLSEAGGRGAGGFLGGILNNPGTVAILAIVAALVIFRGDIRTFFGTTIPEAISGIGSVEFPDITFPTIEFPEITFPEFPEFPDFTSQFEDFRKQFEDFFSQFGGDGGGEVPPGEIGDSGITLPEGCFIDSQGRLDCPSPPTFDVCETNPELCEEEPTEDLPPGFIGPPGPGQQECFDIPVLTGGSFNSCTGEFTPPITPPTPPGPTLPPGFEGGGPSFEGGTIFPIDICNMSLSDIIDANPGISASQAANMKFEACEAAESDFDFGTNTGSGFGPGDDPLTDPLVTGGATLESEAKKAACLSCELFGLNCGICRGTI